MGKPEKQEPKKAPVATTRSPQGGLPKKKRGPTTTGTTLVEDANGFKKSVPYVPSKQVKARHRRAVAGGDIAKRESLKEFTTGSTDPAVKDWLANKKASGRG